jgi:chaperonin GroEL
MEVCLEGCRILLHDRSLETARDVVPVLELCHAERKPLLVVAEKIRGEALQTLLANRSRGAFLCAAVESPAFSGARQDLLGDLAAVTGATVVSPELGRGAGRIAAADLGSARQVIVGRGTTTILAGGGSAQATQARARQIRRRIREGVSDFDREKLELRLASLLGGIAVVHVGSATEIDLKEKKARFESAVSAVRAALEGGVVPGGGLALLRAAAVLDSLRLPEDEMPAVGIVRRAVEEPARRIAANAGHDPSVVIADVRSRPAGVGFNAATERYEDLLRAGIVDSAKVVRIALQSAASVALLLLTTEATITESRDVAEKTYLDPPRDMSPLKTRSGRIK